MDRDLYQSRRNFQWVEASLMLLREFADRGGRRVLMAGSSAEYDWSHGTCSEEKTPLAPKTVYGACKSALGQLFASFVRSTELSGAWPRIFFSYGPGEHPDRLVAHVVSAILQGRPARCTHGDQLRDYLYVEDVASALIAILDSDLQGPVNVGSGQPTRLKDMILTIARALGREDLVELGALPVAEDDPPLVLADVGRLAEELGWRPDSSLDDGIEHTIAYWRQQLPEPVMGEA
jgi:nucleoside-diphosphate-sugar epimerase